MPTGEAERFGKGHKVVVTILGKSGSGKTVFLSSLYSQLAEGVLGFTAAALDHSTDRILGAYLERFYLEKEAPEGTKDNSILYAFSLLFEGQPVVDLDCFDYRGGAIEDDASTDAGKVLSDRIANSDILIWLVDLSTAVDRHGGLHNRRARMATRLRRIQSISSQAVQLSPRSRVWSFVRSKVDLNFEDVSSKESLETATKELYDHVKDVIPIATCNNGPSTLISNAPIGKATVTDDCVIPGDEAVNVEWPLLLPLSWFIRERVRVLAELTEAALSKASRNEPHRGFFAPKRDAVDTPPDQEIAEAEKERDFLARVLQRIESNVPTDILVVDSTDGGADSANA